MAYLRICWPNMLHMLPSSLGFPLFSQCHRGSPGAGMGGGNDEREQTLNQILTVTWRQQRCSGVFLLRGQSERMPDGETLVVLSQNASLKCMISLVLGDFHTSIRL